MDGPFPFPLTDIESVEEVLPRGNIITYEKLKGLDMLNKNENKIIWDLTEDIFCPTNAERYKLKLDSAGENTTLEIINVSSGALQDMINMGIFYHKLCGFSQPMIFKPEINNNSNYDKTFNLIFNRLEKLVEKINKK